MTIQLPFYRDPSIKEQDFFDEGPNLPLTKTTSIYTSSIDTSAIDGYRQGVEITHQKFFDAGTVKISAGEPAHVLRKNRFGEDNPWDIDPRYADKDYFDPVTFLTAQATSSPLLSSILTFPIITADATQINNINFDGVIEPLTIRSVASFFSTDVPFESHGTRGELMAGNVDSLLSSDQVVTVDYFSTRQSKPFLDMIELFGTLSTTGFFINNALPQDPFVDKRYIENVVHSASIGIDMLQAQSLMTGSTDNYVPFNKRSATSGWTFDSVSGIGTDSVAFGGRTH